MQTPRRQHNLRHLCLIGLDVSFTQRHEGSWTERERQQMRTLSQLNTMYSLLFMM